MVRMAVGTPSWVCGLGCEFVLSGNVPGTVQPAPGHAPTAPGVTAGRFRAASPALAWVLGGAVLVLAAAVGVLSALAGQLSIDITAGVVIVLTFAGWGW